MKKDYKDFIPSGESIGCLYWIVIGLIALVGMGWLQGFEIFLISFNPIFLTSYFTEKIGYFIQNFNERVVSKNRKNERSPSALTFTLTCLQTRSEIQLLIK